MSENELVQRNVNAGLPAVPDYLKVEDDHSLDGVKQYVRPPRIKVVQATSLPALKDAFGVGAVVLVPDNTLVLAPMRDALGNIEYGTTPPFIFTPIFFFTEFCLWNPLQMKGKLPAIRERSFDQNSRLAQRARDFKNRDMPCPEDPEHNCTFCEHMNFIVHVPGQKDHCVLSFSRGEFAAGQRFAGLLKMRGVPMYGNIFEAHIARRENNKGNWIGLDCVNPSGGESPFVGEEAFHAFQKLYNEYATLYKEKLIDVTYEEEPIDVAVSGAADSM
jgi:hypothetical protein